MIVNNKSYTKSVRLSYSKLEQIEYLKSCLANRYMCYPSQISFTYVIMKALDCLEKEFKNEEIKNE